ncbi:MAG: hypothetical protein ACREJO_03705 [Phycisphaerales bacterium]
MVFAAGASASAQDGGGAFAVRTGLMMAAEPPPQPAANPGAGSATSEAAQAAAEQSGIGSGRPDPWTVQIQGRGWYVAPSGDVRIAGSTGSMDLQDVGADNPRWAPVGQVDIQAERLLITLRGTHLDEQSTAASSATFNLGGMAVASGDWVQTNMKWTCLELSGGWLVFDYDFEKGGQPDPKKENQFNLWVIGGGRMYDYSFDVTKLSGGAGAVTTSQTYGEVYGGVRLELQLWECLSAEAEGSVGGWPGSRSSMSWDIMVAFNWRACEHFGLQVGYRLLMTDTRNGDGAGQSGFDGSFAGLFVGAVLRF